MDPNITWREFLEAINGHDINTANERAWALHEWLSKEGFMPAQARGLSRQGLLVLLTAFVGYFGDPGCGADRAIQPDSTGCAHGDCQCCSDENNIPFLSSGEQWECPSCHHIHG